MERHFCVTVYIYSPNKNQFLFIKHKKIQKWLSPGGHIEENENPEEAALREVKEETGLEVSLIGDRFPTEKDLLKPYAIQRNITKEKEHEHYDIIYLAFPNSEDIKLNNTETDDISWFAINDIISPMFDTFEDKKILCKYFINEIINNDLVDKWKKLSTRG